MTRPNLTVISAPPPDVFHSQEPNVKLVENAIMSAAFSMLALRRARAGGDLSSMEDANDMMGIQLRAAERLQAEIADAIELQRERDSR